jgi:AcrR family transcriptional regulator
MATRRRMTKILMIRTKSAPARSSRHSAPSTGNKEKHKAFIASKSFSIACRIVARVPFAVSRYFCYSYPHNIADVCNGYKGKDAMAHALVRRNAVAGKNGERPAIGLRERKKARLRQQIIDTSIRLFRRHGYEATRVDDIVQLLEISQPTFFRYFSSKDAVLREVGERGYACICERLRSELSNRAGTGERLRRLYVTMAREVGSRPAALASGGAVGRHGSGAICRTARVRGSCCQPAAGISDARAEAGRSDARISRRAPGGVHGRSLQHRGAAVGGRSHGPAPANRPCPKRSRVFPARHPPLGIPHGVNASFLVSNAG